MNKASTGEEESRYSQRTLADIRDNLAGTTTVYDFFQPWLSTKANGRGHRREDRRRFCYLDADPLRDVPGRHDSRAADDVEFASPDGDLYMKISSTPFGQLYTGVRTAADPNTAGSIVFEMNAAAVALGFPEFQATP